MLSYVYARSILNPPTSWIHETFCLCLECNNFVCDTTFYLQASETAQSNHMSCFYSVIAFAVYDEKAMDNPFKPLIWKGFRNDVTALWICSLEDAKSLMEYFNSIILKLLFQLNAIMPLHF